MPNIETRWWGFKLDLTKQEACSATDPRTELAQFVTQLGVPFAGLVITGIQAAKVLIRRAIGEDGISANISWLGVPLSVVGLGNTSPCQLAIPSPAALTTPRSVTLMPATLEFFKPADPLPAGSEVIPDTTGSIFRITKNDFLESNENGVFSIEITNSSGDWIEVIVERPDGSMDKSGRIPDGQQGTINNWMSLFRNGRNHIIRWRRGFAGIPGTGGGEVFVTVPDSVGSGVLGLTVVG